METINLKKGDFLLIGQPRITSPNYKAEITGETKTLFIITLKKPSFWAKSSATLKHKFSKSTREYILSGFQERELRFNKITGEQRGGDMFIHSKLEKI